MTRENNYYRPMRPPYEVWQDDRRFAAYSALKDAVTCANDLATDYPYSNLEVRREGRVLFHGVARYRPATDSAIDNSFDSYR